MNTEQEPNSDTHSVSPAKQEEPIKVSPPQLEAQPFNAETPTRRSVTPMLVIGIGILFLGSVLMMDNLRVPGTHYLWRLWPLIIVAIGVLQIRTRKGSCVGGYILLALGCLLSFSTIFNIDLGNLIAPLWLIGIGVLIVLHALNKQRRVPPCLKDSEDFLKGMAIFSAFKHRHPHSSFKGGELTALFGGVELDLRDATMAESYSRLDCFIMFGGGEIRVPDGWDVRVKVTAMFGGVNNKSIPLPRDSECRPILDITGMVLFGGIEIR